MTNTISPLKACLPDENFFRASIMQKAIRDMAEHHAQMMMHRPVIEQFRPRPGLIPMTAGAHRTKARRIMSGLRWNNFHGMVLPPIRVYLTDPIGRSRTGSSVNTLKSMGLVAA